MRRARLPYEWFGAFVGVIVCGQALAFPDPVEWSDYRWANNEIAFNLPSGNWDARGTAKFRSAERGINSWDHSNVPGTTLTLTTIQQNGDPTDNSDVVNTLGFVNVSLGNGVLARTSRRFASAPYKVWVEADVEIVQDSPPPSNVPQFTWVYSAQQADPLPDAAGIYRHVNLEAIVRHEIGHCLGFVGEETQLLRLAVMNPWYSYGGAEDV